MVNQKGEFPMTARVSTRVPGSTKRLLKKLKQSGHSESDVIEYAAKQLSKEPVLLDWEIGEYDLQIAECEANLFELKAKRQAKLNRLKLIAPKMIDEDTMNNMLIESAKDYARTLVSSRDNFSVDLLDNPTAKASVRSVGDEWGYDSGKFLVEVRKQVRLICHTQMSDI